MATHGAEAQPDFAAILRTAHDSLAASLEADVNDREARLTSVVNVLGFSTLDDLEDFVYLHGGGKVVPAAQRDTLPLDETQTQLSETRRTKRNEERRAENATLKRDLATVRAELQWARSEAAKAKEEKEELVKDKRRLLNTVESLRTATGGDAVVLARPASSLSQAGMSPTSELRACWDEVESLQATVAQLEAELVSAQTLCDEQAVELRDLREEVVNLQQDKSRAETLEAELLQLRERISSLVPAILSGGPIPATPAFSAVTPSGATVRPAPTSSLPPLRLSNAAADPSPSVRPSLSTTGPPQTTPRPTQPHEVPSETDQVTPDEPPQPSTSRQPATPAPPQPNGAEAGHDHAELPSATIPHPRVAAISSAPSTSAASASPTASLSSRLQNKIRLYPSMFASYNKNRSLLLDQVARTRELEATLADFPSSVSDRLRAQAGPPPVVDIDHFPEPAALPADSAERKEMAMSGRLEAIYEDLRVKELEISKIAPNYKIWVTKLADCIDNYTLQAQEKEVEEVAANAKGKKRAAPTEAGTPAASAMAGQPVKRRRKVISGATPATSVAGTPIPRPSLIKPRSPRPSPRKSPRKSPRHSPYVSPRKQLLVGGATTTPGIATEASPSTSTKKRRWNLVSPKKKDLSGVKKQLWTRRDDADGATAADPPTATSGTQPPPLPSSPAVKRINSEGDREASTYEPEPDTLRTDLSSQTGRRSSITAGRSSSPRKPTPRRSISVASSSALQVARRNPPVAAVDENDPFVDRGPAKAPRPPSPAGALPLQPSPRSRLPQTSPRKGKSRTLVPTSPASRAATPSPVPSPSQSPSKELSMPPSAQISSRRLPMQSSPPLRGPSAVQTSDAAKRALIPDSDGEDEVCAYELRFFDNLGTPPLPRAPTRRQNASQKTADVASGSRGTVARSQRVKAESQVVPLSPSPKKRKQRKAASKTEAVKTERGAQPATPKKEVFGRERWLDLDQSTPDYPEDPDDEQSRKFWIERTRLKRRVKLQKDKQDSAKKAGSSMRVLEINPKRNKGEKQFFKEVVRNKEERSKMLAEACAECTAYFDRSGTENTCNHRRQPAAATYLEERAAASERRLQAIGRHRVQQPTVEDPPQYWEFGIPTTQDAEKLNQEARRKKERARALQEAEADTPNGLYRWRDT
ncbi:DNA endonuclease RBBP8 [Rhodotorula toruloides]|nr:DNA endonuclease RBBP8 [Rhodotorula toruloides]